MSSFFKLYLSDFDESLSVFSRRESKSPPWSLVIGNFDGIHRGHQQLIRASLDWSQAYGGQSFLLTFDPHPVQVFHPEVYLSRLFSLDDQSAEIRRHGFSGLFVQNFSEAFRKLHYKDFLKNYLVKYFYPQHLVVGHDFRYGARKEGNTDKLNDFCNKNDIYLDIIPPFILHGEIVSTSAIRRFLQTGFPQKAKEFLGRPYVLNGSVIRGTQNGRVLGFPTANLSLELNNLSLRRGVYVTRVKLENGTVFRSVTNVGWNPTINSSALHNSFPDCQTDLFSQVKVETHILDFNQYIYGERIQIEFEEFLREEKKFDSLEELKKQIQRDVDESLRFWDKMAKSAEGKKP